VSYYTDMYGPSKWDAPAYERVKELKVENAALKEEVERFKLTNHEKEALIVASIELNCLHMFEESNSEHLRDILKRHNY